MAKQLVSKDQKYYLKDKEVELTQTLDTLSLSVLKCLIDSYRVSNPELSSSLQSIYSLLNSFIKESRYNYSYGFENASSRFSIKNLLFTPKGSNQELTLLQLLNELTLKHNVPVRPLNIKMATVELSPIILSVPTPLNTLGASPPGPKANKNIKELAQAALSGLDLALAEFNTWPDIDKNIVFTFSPGRYYEREIKEDAILVNNYTYKLDKNYAKNLLINIKNIFLEIKEAIDSLNAPFNANDYKLSSFQGAPLRDANELKTLQAYYLFFSDSYGPSGFIAQSKTKHSTPRYQWALSKNLKGAHLFQQPIESVLDELPWDETNLTQIYAKLDFDKIVSLGKDSLPPEIMAIQAMIDKNQMEDLLPSIQEAASIESSAVITKKNKI